MAVRRAVAAMGLVGLGGWALIEPHFPVLRRRTVALLPPGAASIRLLHLSDLHLLPGHHTRAAWVRGLSRLDPDLVVSTGDHLSDAAALPLLASTYAAFDAPGFVVPGNNDYYLPRRPSPLGYFSDRPAPLRAPDLSWAQAATALSAAGWTDLTHVRAERLVRGVTVTLTGTDDGHLRRDRYPLVAGPVAGEVGIGVTHTPARRLLDAMVTDGHRLLLAGHTHGGQLRLPVAGALVTNCDLARRRARGLSRYGSAWLHVSAGLGTSPYAPVRFCCRPEATLLTLDPVR